MTAARRHHHSSRRSSKHRRSRSKSRARATGRKRLNVKFLILLLLVFGVVGVGALGILYRQHRHNPEVYVRRADALVAEQKYAQAVRQYEKAHYYDENNTEILGKMAAALLNVQPESATRAAQNTMRVLGILSRITMLDQHNMHAQQQLLEMMYDHAQELAHPVLYNQLLSHADRFLQNNADNRLALRYKALAEGELMRRDELGEQDALRARDNIEAALKDDPGNPQLVRYLSMWYSTQARRASTGQILADPANLQASAQTVLTDYQADHPEDLETTLLLAQTYAMHDQTDKARDIMHQVEQDLLAVKAPQLIPQAARFIISLDHDAAATTEGKLTTDGLLRAEQLLRTAYQRNAADLESTVSLALLLKNLDKTEESIALLEDAFAEDGASTSGMSPVTVNQLRLVAGTNLANTYLSTAEKTEDPLERAELIEKAEGIARRLRGDISSSGVTDLLEGKIQMLKGNLTEAVEKFETADRRFSGSNPEPIFLSAIVLKRRGETGAAAERLERLAAGIEGPRALRVLRELATIYFQVNDLHRADRTVDKMLEVAPDNEEALILRSEVLLRRRRQAADDNQTARARQYLQDAFRILRPMADSGSLRAQLQLSRVYQANNEIAMARTVLADSWENHPDNYRILQQLVRLDIEAEDREAAMERVAEARLRNPDSRVLQLLQTQLRGDDDALASLERLLADNEDAFGSSLNLYALYRRTGQEDRAREMLEAASAIRPEDERVLAETFNEALRSEDWETADRLARQAASQNLDGARGLFWLGRLEMAQGQHHRATGTLQLAVRQRPLYSDGWRMLGDALRMVGDLIEAEKAYQEALKVKPDNLTALINLFATHDARGLYQVALADLERAVELAPSNRQVRSMYLEYLARQHPQRALTQRLRLQEQNPDDLENRQAIARLYARTGNTDRALSIAGELRDRAPDNFGNIVGVAQIMNEVGRFGDGHQMLQDFLAQHADELEARHWIEVARYRLAGNLTPHAIEAYEQAISLEDPVHREASRELADWYFNNQFFTLALPLYREAFRQSRDPRLWLRYIDTLTHADRLSQAQRLLDDFVSTHGHSTQSALLECLIALRNEEFPRATRAADRAIELNPDYPQAYLHRARTLIMADQREGRQRAIRDLRRSLSLDPTLTPAREMLVELYLSTSDADIPAAIDQLLSILQHNPRHVPARLRLSQLYLHTNHKTRLTDLLNESIALMPEVPAWYALRGQLALQEDRPQDAVADLREAFDREQTAETLNLLCHALAKAGKPRDAASMLSNFAQQVERSPVLLATKAALLHATDQKPAAQETLKTALRMAGPDPQVLQAIVQQAKGVLSLRAAGELLSDQARSDSTGLLALFTGQLLIEANLNLDALACLETARMQVRDNPTLQSRIAHLLAHANQELEDYRSAADLYRQLIERDRTDVIALNNLSFLYAEYLDQPKEALEYARRAVELASGDPAVEGNVLDTLGWAQFKSGMVDEARITLQRSIRQAPDSLHNRYHMAHVLVARGQMNEAQLQLRMLMRMAHERGDEDMLRKALVLNQQTE